MSGGQYSAVDDIDPEQDVQQASIEVTLAS
jgi:hypothetical protein